MRLGLILGDQLSLSLPTLQQLDTTSDMILMVEAYQEATYVPHHPQKIALIFSAMRHFGQALEQRGWQVHYHRLNEVASNTLFDSVEQVCTEHDLDEVVVTECGEYRLQTEMQGWTMRLGRPVRILEDRRFLCSHSEFETWAGNRSSLRMEFFYREMRRRTGLLMEGDQPVGGKWNFDAENRQKYKGQVPLPVWQRVKRDETDLSVMELVAERFGSHPGALEPFQWATTREQALERLAFFTQHCLPYFGDYQDAMVLGEGRLFHSLISPYLNCGLLDPIEVCLAAEQAWQQQVAPLNAVEGFIRQIIGWREFVRGVYWLKMPGYGVSNFFNHTTDLPDFFWTGNVNMQCVAESVGDALTYSYSHHIQRLMVIGNFANLAGLAPEQVQQWFLAVYADAYEWVELPNVVGMALYADGGVLASKPYIASGNYINKMSDYCKHCCYQVKTSDEPDSCPFNSLYWGFVHQHRSILSSNPRMSMVYRNLDRQTADKQQRILSRATELKSELHRL